MGCFLQIVLLLRFVCYFEFGCLGFGDLAGLGGVVASGWVLLVVA